MALHLYIKSPVKLISIKYLKDISEVMLAVHLELYSKEEIHHNFRNSRLIAILRSVFLPYHKFKRKESGFS